MTTKANTRSPVAKGCDIEAQLPFVRTITDLKTGEKRRNFWAVPEPSGSSLADCELGMQYAEQCVTQAQVGQFPCYLGWIVRDMAQSGRLGQMELGFLERISELAVLGHVRASCWRAAQ